MDITPFLPWDWTRLSCYAHVSVSSSPFYWTDLIETGSRSLLPRQVISLSPEQSGALKILTKSNQVCRYQEEQKGLSLKLLQRLEERSESAAPSREFRINNGKTNTGLERYSLSTLILHHLCLFKISKANVVFISNVNSRLIFFYKSNHLSFY